MKKLYEYEPKLKIPRLREILIKIHRDLLTIDQRVSKVAIDNLSTLNNVEKLVLVLEDRRFLSHCGVDLKSSMREILRAISRRKHGGASTIDMQFVRTVTGYRERTLRRKLYEMLLAFFIQFRYSKVAILKSYLECAFLGSHLKGVEEAAQKVFNTSSDSLSIEDASFIAAMLVYPRPLKPTEKWKLNVERRASYGKRIYLADKERFDQMPS